MTVTTSEPYILDAVIRRTIDNTLNNLHTIHPCQVAVVRSNGTVDVNLMIYRVLENDEALPIATLTQLPVLFQGNNTYAMSFPVSVGDEGIVLFAERDISKYLEQGKGDKPVALRSFALSDAMYLPTPISKPNRVQSRNDVLLMSNNTTEIEIADGVIRLNGNVEINGDVLANGNLDSTGEVTAKSDDAINSVELSTHQHCYSDTGVITPTTPPSKTCPPTP